MADHPTPDTELLLASGWTADEVDALSGPALTAAADAVRRAGSAPKPEKKAGEAASDLEWEIAEQEFAERAAHIRTDEDVAQRHADLLAQGDDEELCDRLSLSHTDLAALRDLA